MMNKKFVVVEYFESYEKTIVEAETKEEAEEKIRTNDDHNGEIVEVYEIE